MIINSSKYYTYISIYYNKFLLKANDEKINVRKQQLTFVSIFSNIQNTVVQIKR